MYKIISGIYMIKCAINGDRYIGSSKSLFSRKSNHWILLRKNKHHNAHLQNVWNKYGELCFVFEILEFVQPQKLLEREQYWIDELKPELNKAIKADSGFLGKKHSQDTREKLSNIQKERLKSPELIERLRDSAKAQAARQTNGMKGKHLSSETKEKLRNATLNQFSNPERKKKHKDAMKKWMTPEMKERISHKKKGVKPTKEAVEARRAGLILVWQNYPEATRLRRIEKTSMAVIKSRAKLYKGFVSPDGNIYKDVYNLAEFCRKHNLSISEMNSLANEKRKSYKGWQRIED